jgi:hypothetical protein
VPHSIDDQCVSLAFTNRHAGFIVRQKSKHSGVSLQYPGEL